MEWLRQQGPWCPALLEYLQQHHASYDALIFFTYLYAPTVLGLKVAPARSILVPTAHDEPAIRLEICEVFGQAGQPASPTTRRPSGASSPRLSVLVPVLVETRWLRRGPAAAPRLPPALAAGDEVAAGVDETPAEGEDGAPGRIRSHLTSRGAMFRRRHRLHGPFALYGGRIDPGKGCEELIEYFSTYVQEGGDASLVLMGVKLMPLPEEPFINFAGLLSDQERVQALEAATVVVVPSPYESLSLLALEAFAVGTPVLANARSEVLVDHCLSSNAGLFYADRDEFVECLSLLVSDERLRAALGQNGRDYVRKSYRWDVGAGQIREDDRQTRSGRVARPVTQPSRVSAASSAAPFSDRLRRVPMSWRLIISFSVVGFRCNSSAAFFCTPPAASRVDSITRFSKSAVTSLNQMPSAGSVNCGILKTGRFRT